MNVSTIFRSVRKLLGDTFIPYRNTDNDLVDGLTSCIEDLYSNKPDLFLDDSLQVVNNYVEPINRGNDTAYNVGDIIYMNDPIDLYICSVAGTTALNEPSFDDVSILDGTVSWALWQIPEGINTNAIMHYMAYFCLMMDNDEQANEALANRHYTFYQGSV